MKKLARLNREMTVDLLSERLAFEARAVTLYEALLERAALSTDPIIAKALPALARVRFEEFEHARWLDDQIRALGGDPAASTPRSRLVAEEARGLESIVLAPRRSFEEALHAIQAAELADHSGWFLLINLASEAEDDEAQEALRPRMNQENQHLHLIRTIAQAFARREVLGITTDVSRKAA